MHVPFPCVVCAECPRDKNPVPGHGPLPCDLLFIGEAPGGNEDITGIPFSGMTGYELDNLYLRLCGRRRPTVRVTNTVRCRPENNKTPSARLAACCSLANLKGEIAACKPKIIVLLGATASRLDPTIDTKIELGVPRQSSFLGWSGTVVPMIHPSAGLHSGNKMIPLMEDFETLRDVIAGRYVPPVDPFPIVDYQYCHTPRHLNAYIDAYSNDENLTALDTEGHGKRQHSIQISREPGTGIMLLCENKLVIEAFRKRFNSIGDYVMQFAEHDMDFLQGLGFNTYDDPSLIVWDTMRDAYNFGNLPQGLKAMTFRTQHIKMRTWEDVVLPHSKRVLMKWLPESIGYAAGHFYETKDTVTFNMSKLEMALNRIVKKLGKDTGKLMLAVDRLMDQPGYYALLKQIHKPPRVTSPGFVAWLDDAIKFSKKYLAIKKVKTERKRGELERGLARIMMHTAKPTYKSWDKLREMVNDLDAPVKFEFLEREVGDLPLLGIGNVPYDEALMYAVGDADMTLRNVLWGNRRRVELSHKWEVMDGDEDQ